MPAQQRAVDLTVRRCRLSLLVGLTCVTLSACAPSDPSTSTASSAFDDMTPRFSPYGERIVFVRDQGDDSDIYVINVRGRRARLLANVSEYDLDPVFSPDGSQVLFDTSPNGYPQLHLVPSDGGEIRPISKVVDGWATFPAWAPDGKTIVYSCGRPAYPESDLRLLSQRGEFLGLLGEESSSQELEPSWSSDGTTVAFASNRSGNSDVYLIDVRSGRVTKLTDEPSHDADPAWSPDGSTIAFTSDRSGTPQVCLMLADGNDVRCLTEGAQPAWSPDGGSLTFYRNTPFGSRIFLANADGRGVVQIS